MVTMTYGMANVGIKCSWGLGREIAMLHFLGHPVLIHITNTCTSTSSAKCSWWAAMSLVGALLVNAIHAHIKLIAVN